MVTVQQAQKRDEAELIRVASKFPVQSHLQIFGIEKLLSNSSVCLMVTRIENQIIGYLLAYNRHTHPAFIGLDAIEIEEIIISEKFRRKGIGKLLMENFEHWARKQQFRIVVIGGAPAVDFYQALGYHKESSGVNLKKKL